MSAVVMATIKKQMPKHDHPKNVCLFGFYFWQFMAFLPGIL